MSLQLCHGRTVETGTQISKRTLLTSLGSCLTVFNVHHDLGDYDDETGLVELPPKSLFSKRRIVTIFCYLNDVDHGHGGETAFPSCPLSSPGDDGPADAERVLKIRPHPGRAVIWSNVLPNGQPDPRTVHAGLPVERGIKYGLNIWITEN